jgi:DNA-binding MarR family transcriptional regulator
LHDGGGSGHDAAGRKLVRATLGGITEPDFAILLAAANRCVSDRLVAAVSLVGGAAMRPSFGFVIRAVAAEEPTVSRLAELLDVTKQAASKLADDMVSAGFLVRGHDAHDRRRTPLHLTELGEAVRTQALAESRAMDGELRNRFGDEPLNQLRTVLAEFVVQHGGGSELAAMRSRAPSA